MNDLSLELSEAVKQRLGALTRTQRLAAAVLGVERMWQMFEDWTRQESAPGLRRSPREFRMPFRLALDLLWKPVETGKPYSEHCAVFDRLYEFVESSYDEEDALDVDFGDVRLFVDELVSGGIAGFFPIPMERQLSAPWNAPDFYVDCAARFVTLYAEQLYEHLYERYCEQNPSGKREAELCGQIAGDALWIAETERIESDLTLVRDYPSNREAVLQRRAENRALRTPPFCSEDIP